MQQSVLKNQKLIKILWHPEVHYHVHNSPPLVPILSHFILIHNHPPYFCTIHFNILQSTVSLANGFLPSGFPPKPIMHYSSPHTHHMAAHLIITHITCPPILLSYTSHAANLTITHITCPPILLSHTSHARPSYYHTYHMPAHLTIIHITCPSILLSFI